MNEKLASTLEKLKSEISSSPEMKKLKELDKKLSEDEEVMKLAYKKDMASVKYEDALKHFKEDSKEVSDAQKELYQAKLELDKNELVISYNEQFKIVRKMYDKINEEIFGMFTQK